MIKSNLPRPLDTILAFKAACISAEISGTDKRVFAAILDSYNRKTGQCDPSLGRVAHLLGISRRTVIRSVERLVSLKFLSKLRHGGGSHRNSYQPNWSAVRTAEAQWEERKRTKHWDAGDQELSLLRVPESSHADGGRAGTQTCLINQSPSTSPKTVHSREALPDDRAKEIDKSCFSRAERRVGFASWDAASAAAERRWNNDLLARYRRTSLYAEIVWAIDVEIQEAATNAEMRRPTALR